MIDARPLCESRKRGELIYNSTMYIHNLHGEVTVNMKRKVTLAIVFRRDH